MVLLAGLEHRDMMETYALASAASMRLYPLAREASRKQLRQKEPATEQRDVTVKASLLSCLEIPGDTGLLWRMGALHTTVLSKHLRVAVFGTGLQLVPGSL